MEIEKSLCKKRLKQLAISPLHKDNPGLEQNKKMGEGAYLTYTYTHTHTQSYI